MRIKRVDKFYTAPEEVTLPDGKVMWFSNEYRYNARGISYNHETKWYNSGAVAERWYTIRRNLADVKLRG